jgi:parallel beta-helix repeat protein
MYGERKMSKRLFSSVMFLLLLASMLVLAFEILPVRAEPRTWIVDDDAPADFHTIGEALTFAGTGDTIYVRNGTYSEHIIISDKFNLRILGEDKNNTIIDGMGYGPIVTIFEGFNNTFANFTVRNAGWTNWDRDNGIRIRMTRSCKIVDCIVSSCVTGIREMEWYDMGRGNIISGNTVSDCTQAAIGSYEEDLPDDIVSNNTITNSTYGINFYNPFNLQIIGNHIFGTESQYNQYGIYQYGGSNNTIIGNRIEYSYNAIEIDFASSNVIEENTVENCTNGVFVGYESSNNIIVGNNASSSSIGFTLGYMSNGNLFANNQATNNGYAVALSSSYNNRIYHNNFINNVQQAYIEAPSYTNSWDDGYPSGGNYWSDYSGLDFFNGPYQNATGSDGIGDTSYSMDVDNTDNYPLMNSYQPSHDIAIADAFSLKSVVGLGYSLNLTFSVANQGDCVETFNVTFYVNTTLLASQMSTLPSMINSNVTFTLNITGFVYGNYTLNVCAVPSPNETNTFNNNYTCSTSIHVGVPADVSGPILGVYDGTCNMRDVQYMIILFAHSNPNADVNNDGTVNMRDIMIAILNFNKHE